jgi:hypothetical protein
VPAADQKQLIGKKDSIDVEKLRRSKMAASGGGADGDGQSSPNVQPGLGGHRGHGHGHHHHHTGRHRRHKQHQVEDWQSFFEQTGNYILQTKLLEKQSSRKGKKQ